MAVQHEKAAQERILDAARELFADRGFHQTSMADLAKAACVSVGAIYRSYASKSDIIDAIIRVDTEQLLGDLQADLETVRNGTVSIDEALERIILRSTLEKQEALTHEILAEGHRSPHVAANITAFCRQTRDIFAELAQCARPSLSGEELDGAAELLLACQFGIGHRDLADPKLDEATTARISANLILKALRAN